MSSRLVIVTGASGAVGKSFINHFLKQADTTCIAISRAFIETEATHYQADLHDPIVTETVVNHLNLSKVSDIILIHGVGKFKYEYEDRDQFIDGDCEQIKIDDEVYSSNYHTFVNISKPLVEKLEQENQKGHQTRLALCGFGSITDKYKIPFWHSYTYAKDTLREYIKTLAYSESWEGLIRGRFINVSTTDTGNENKLRPNATAEEKKYWLKPDKVVEQSIEHLEKFHPLWQEIDVFEPMPGFHPDHYYTNHDEIQQKWLRQTGLNQSQV
jgi:short-subunit dehydrogenase